MESNRSKTQKRIIKRRNLVSILALDKSKDDNSLSQLQEANEVSFLKDVQAEDLHHHAESESFTQMTENLELQQEVRYQENEALLSNVSTQIDNVLSQKTKPKSKNEKKLTKKQENKAGWSKIKPHVKIENKKIPNNGSNYGPTKELPRKAKQSDFFSQIMTDDLIKSVINYSTENAVHDLNKKERNGKMLTKEESTWMDGEMESKHLKAFLGCLIIMGIDRKNGIREHFGRDEL